LQKKRTRRFHRNAGGCYRPSKSSFGTRRGLWQRSHRYGPSRAKTLDPYGIRVRFGNQIRSENTHSSVQLNSVRILVIGTWFELRTTMQLANFILGVLARRCAIGACLQGRRTVPSPKTQLPRNLAKTEPVLSEFVDLRQIEAPSRSTAYRFGSPGNLAGVMDITERCRVARSATPPLNQQERQI